jgi:hypothetical protein
MARPKKVKVEVTAIEHIVEAKVEEVAPIETPTTTEMKVTDEEVKPIVVSTSTFVNGDKVKLINSVTNKVIAMATSRKLADKLIAKNPNLKIV